MGRRESMAQIVVEVDALGESRRKVALQYARVADTPETARKQAEVRRERNVRIWKNLWIKFSLF